MMRGCTRTGNARRSVKSGGAGCMPGGRERRMVVILSRLNLVGGNGRKAGGTAVSGYMRGLRRFESCCNCAMVGISRMGESLSGKGGSIFRPVLSRLGRSKGITRTDSLMLSVFSPVECEARSLGCNSMAGFEYPEAKRGFFEGVDVLGGDCNISNVNVKYMFVKRANVLGALPGSGSLGRS